MRQMQQAMLTGVILEREDVARDESARELMILKNYGQSLDLKFLKML